MLRELSTRQSAINSARPPASEPLGRSPTPLSDAGAGSPAFLAETRVLRRPRGFPPPCWTASYIDMIGGWLKQPLDAERRTWLEQRCRGTCKFQIKKPRFRRADDPDREYAEWVALRQPTREALEYLATRNDFLLNRAELSYDQFFADEEQLAAAFLFTIEHTMKPGRRSSLERCTIYFGKKGPTFYGAARVTPNKLVLYSDKKSKVSSDDPHVLHADWRFEGVEALQSAGLPDLNSILQLDHDAFWQQKLTYWEIDHEALGRAYLNWQEGKQQRSPRTHTFRNTTMSLDKRIGHLIARSAGLFTKDQLVTKEDMPIEDLPGYFLIYQATSLQNVIDAYAGKIRIKDFIKPMELIPAIAANQRTEP